MLGAKDVKRHSRDSEHFRSHASPDTRHTNCLGYR